MFLSESVLEKATGTVYRPAGTFVTTEGPNPVGLWSLELSEAPRAKVRGWFEKEQKWVKGVLVTSDEAAIVMGTILGGPVSPGYYLNPMRYFIVKGSFAFEVEPNSICRPTGVYAPTGAEIWEGDIVQAESASHPEAVGIVCENVKWREDHHELKWWVHMKPSKFFHWGEWIELNGDIQWKPVGSIRSDLSQLGDWDGGWYETAAPDELGL